MENRDFSARRRAVLAALGGVVLAPIFGPPAFPQSGSSLSLRAVRRMVRLRADLPESAIAVLDTGGDSASLRLGQNADIQVSLSSELSGLSAWNFIGFDNANSAQPLLIQKPLANGNRTSFALPLRQAGTFLISGLVGDLPSSARALIVEDAKPTGVDRDEVLLIQDWRVMADGKALVPGIDPANAAVVYTVNGQPEAQIKLRPNERLRLRVINGCQRAPIGLKIENAELRVMAIDSQPAEPFVAREGQLVLTPGSRTDVFIDATQPPNTTCAIMLFDGTTPRKIGQLTIAGDAVRPTPLPPAPALPSAHLPAQLDLKNATRVDIELNGKAPWSVASEFAPNAKPAFEIKRGRVVVTAIKNTTAAPIVFHPHGHHFRLLDRLDDGWKPFWLDTLLLTAGQTQRIAFLAEFSGQWLIEAAGIDWASPKLLCSYIAG